MQEKHALQKGMAPATELIHECVWRANEARLLR